MRSFITWISISFAVIAVFSACAPKKPITPIQSHSEVSSNVFEIADGGRFELVTNGGEVHFGGVSLVVPKQISGITRKDGDALEVTFSKPLPRGKATRFGMSLSAGIESLRIERERITAYTDTFGKRFVWELKETP